MDVYVVSNVWDPGGSTIVGAAADRSDAEALADRFADRVTTQGWAPWFDISREMGHRMWERIALISSSLSQEIVCVPLASAHPVFVMDDPKVALTWSGVGRGDALTKSSEIQEIGRQFGAP
jgi:hypothetical protein